MGPVWQGQAVPCPWTNYCRWLWHRKVGNRLRKSPLGMKREGSLPQEGLCPLAAGGTDPTGPAGLANTQSLPEGTACPWTPGTAPLTCKPQVMGRQMAGRSVLAGQAEFSCDPHPSPSPPRDMLLRLREPFLRVRRRPRAPHCLETALGNWLVRVLWGPRLRHGRASARLPVPQSPASRSVGCPGLGSLVRWPGRWKLMFLALGLELTFHSLCRLGPSHPSLPGASERTHSSHFQPEG